MGPERVLVNPHARKVAEVPAPSREPLRFHKTLAGYAPTPLHDAQDLAAEIGVGRLWIKDETSRLGLPAFKVLGASWAVDRALLAQPDARVLVAATDGNHGRAVARMARLRGLTAHILVPDDMALVRREAITDEGAELEVITGSYDDAVAASAALADDDHAVVSDTAWPGYETIPAAVIDGYATLLWEVSDELRARAERPPDLVIAQVGVGAFATAVIRQARGPDGWGARMISVEPLSAACALESVAAGRPVAVEPPHDSIMSGLNCGMISPLSWPALSTGADMFVAIEDETAREGMRLLARHGLVGGECSGGPIGALSALKSKRLDGWDALALADHASVLVFLTEGATDPKSYREIVDAR